MNYSSISIKSNKNKLSKNKTLSLLLSKVIKIRDIIIAILNILRENILRLPILFH
jgi:hypothetical protein